MLKKNWRGVKEEQVHLQVCWLLLVPKLCAGRCTSPLLLLCYCCYEFKTCTTGSTRANSRKLHSAEFDNWVTFEHSISRSSSRICSPIYWSANSSQALYNGLTLSTATSKLLFMTKGGPILELPFLSLEVYRLKILVHCSLGALQDL